MENHDRPHSDETRHIEEAQMILANLNLYTFKYVTYAYKIRTKILTLKLT